MRVDLRNSTLKVNPPDPLRLNSRVFCPLMSATRVCPALHETSLYPFKGLHITHASSRSLSLSLLPDLPIDLVDS
jgi:hypothetical protein